MAEPIDLAAHKLALMEATSEANAALVLGAIEALADTSPDPRGAVYWFFAGSARLLAVYGAPLDLLLDEVRRQHAEASAADDASAPAPPAAR